MRPKTWGLGATLNKLRRKSRSFSADSFSSVAFGGESWAAPFLLFTSSPRILSPIPSPPPFQPVSLPRKIVRPLETKFKNAKGTWALRAPSSAPRGQGQEAAAFASSQLPPIRARTMAFCPENEVRRRPGAPRRPNGTRPVIARSEEGRRFLLPR